MSTEQAHFSEREWLAMMPRRFILTLLLVLSCVFVFTVGCRADTEVAQVLSVKPGVFSILAGNETSLQPQMNVPVKATVRSDSTGNAQLMFPDDSTITVAPGTDIELAEFVDTPQKENIALNLAVGTARIITGEVSRRNPLAFTVNTPQAIIGIRGTVATITVSGDSTRIYLSQTSGRGVSVRNRYTGAEMSMRAPGRIITVTPRGLSEDVATHAEVKEFSEMLRTAPGSNRNTRAESRAIQTASLMGTNPGAILSSALLTDTDTGLYVTTIAAREVTDLSPDIMPGPDVGGYVVDLPTLAGVFGGSGPDWRIEIVVPNQYVSLNDNLISFAISGNVGNTYLKENFDFTLNQDGTFGISNPVNANITGQFTSNTDGNVTIDCSNTPQGGGGIVSGPITKQP